MSEEGSCKSKAPPPDLPDRNDRWEVIRWAVKSMEHQRSAVREKVRAAVKAAGIPLPTEVVTKLAQLSHQDVREVLVDHPGFKAWERLGSYRISLRVFERAVPDLLKAIEIFGAAVEDDILSRRKQDELDDIESAIQKELFAVTNAAHSLVDHSESIQELVDIPGYKAKRTEFFGNDGMHEFVRGFRNVLHHRHMIKADGTLNITSRRARGQALRSAGMRCVSSLSSQRIAVARPSMRASSPIFLRHPRSST